MKKRWKAISLITAAVLACSLMLVSCGSSSDSSESTSKSKTEASEESSSSNKTSSETSESSDTSSSSKSSSKSSSTSNTSALFSAKKYNGKPYRVIHNNKPTFKKSQLKAKSTEKYRPLDSLGRCRTAFAIVSKSTMPTGERGSIGMIKPSGWQTVRYSFVDGKYLYNRCHLIGYQLTAENANERNLITGTRYMNVDGMLPFENMVADYVKETGNHVAYKVKPIFKGNDLVAQGVHMMAESVEDGGKGISYNVFCYNVQPGVKIDYSDGTSKMDGTIKGSRISSGYSGYSSSSSSSSSSNGKKQRYVVNVNTGVFHYPSCSSVKLMNESNKKYVRTTRKKLINAGYKPCGNCNP